MSTLKELDDIMSNPTYPRSVLVPLTDLVPHLMCDLFEEVVPLWRKRCALAAMERPRVAPPPGRSHIRKDPVGPAGQPPEAGELELEDIQLSQHTAEQGLANHRQRSRLLRAGRKRGRRRKGKPSLRKRPAKSAKAVVSKVTTTEEMRAWKGYNSSSPPFHIFQKAKPQGTGKEPAVEPTASSDPSLISAHQDSPPPPDVSKATQP